MSTIKNLTKMYCKKNPIKVSLTLGAVVVAGPILGVGMLGTLAVGIGGFLLGKKIENKKDSQ